MSTSNFFDIKQDKGKRDEQQDWTVNVTIDPDHILFVLADGMGGHQAGSTASKTVCLAFENFFEGKKLNDISSDLHEALHFANSKITTLLNKNPALDGMGTTVIALIYNKRTFEYSFISVGDSPLYRFGANGLARINANHAYYEQLLRMVQSGVISQEEADNDPQRHAITSAMMGGNINEIDQKNGILQEGEYILLASDGIQTLNDSSHGEIANVFVKHANDVDSILNQLFSDVKLKNNPHQDNTSAIIIQAQSTNVEIARSHQIDTQPNTTVNTVVNHNDISGYKKPKNIQSKKPSALKYLILFLLLLFLATMAFFVYKKFGTKTETDTKVPKDNTSAEKIAKQGSKQKPDEVTKKSDVYICTDLNKGSKKNDIKLAGFGCPNKLVKNDSGYIKDGYPLIKGYFDMSSMKNEQDYHITIERCKFEGNNPKCETIKTIEKNKFEYTVEENNSNQYLLFYYQDELAKASHKYTYNIKLLAKNNQAINSLDIEVIRDNDVPKELSVTPKFNISNHKSQHTFSLKGSDPNLKIFEIKYTLTNNDNSASGNSFIYKLDLKTGKASLESATGSDVQDSNDNGYVNNNRSKVQYDKSNETITITTIDDSNIESYIYTLTDTADNTTNADSINSVNVNAFGDS